MPDPLQAELLKRQPQLTILQNAQTIGPAPPGDIGPDQMSYGAIMPEDLNPPNSAHIGALTGTLRELAGKMFGSMQTPAEAQKVLGLSERLQQSPVGRDLVRVMTTPRSQGDYIGNLGEFLGAQEDNSLTHHTIDELFKALYGK